MTREEAIEVIEQDMPCEHDKDLIEALEMAISALTEELSADGTLTVHVKDGSKVKRVFVMGDNIFGGLYYPDSAESKPEHEKLMDEINENREKEVVIVPTENKGEWIDISTGKGIFKNRSVKCSKCGNTLDLDGVNCGRGDANFCPNCGADMRGNTKCKRTPKEGNNESYNSYNCENWIP